MVAESYVGVTLWGSQGQPIGLIAVLGRQPLADTRLATSILQVVAVRAAAELERRQAEQALRVSEQQYRSLFEHMLDGFAYCRVLYENGLPRDFIYLEVNSAFERLTGLKNVLGKKVSDVISGVQENNPELFEIYGRVALTGQPERFETFLPSLGIWFSISVYSPRKEHFVAVFDNITARKKAEEALRVSEERYRLLHEQNPDGAFVVDDTGRFLVANPACEVISGYPIAELLQKTFMDICAPDQVARTIEYFERGIREHKSLQLETALVRKDGRRVEVWVAGGPITADGKTVTVHCTARDITERKHMEEEIRQRAEELRATNEELTRFNEAMVGRELRMIDLKQEINELCTRLGQPLRYGPEANAQAAPKA
jgi:PAS domain S-box-containing protein